jgi:hypothetical protein
MKSSSLLLYSLLILLSCTACQKEPSSIIGVDSFRLSSQEVAHLEELAKTETDGQAAFRLHEYHAFFEADPATGRIWLAQAAKQGHTEAMERLKYLEETNGLRK